MGDSAVNLVYPSRLDLASLHRACGLGRVATTDEIVDRDPLHRTKPGLRSTSKCRALRSRRRWVVQRCHKRRAQSGPRMSCRVSRLASLLASHPHKRSYIPVPPVTIHLPSSTHPKTLPKSHPGYGTTLTLLPQPHETVQELKLTINESVVGYWLGPYSLRLPASAAVPAKKEGVDVRAGERLSEWLETGDVFPDAEGERVLEVVRGMLRARVGLIGRTVLRLHGQTDCTAPSRLDRSGWIVDTYAHHFLGCEPRSNDLRFRPIWRGFVIATRQWRERGFAAFVP